VSGAFANALSLGALPDGGVCGRSTAHAGGSRGVTARGRGQELANDASDGSLEAHEARGNLPS